MSDEIRWDKERKRERDDEEKATKLRTQVVDAWRALTGRIKKSRHLTLSDIRHTLELFSRELDITFRGRGIDAYLAYTQQLIQSKLVDIDKRMGEAGLVQEPLPPHIQATVDLADEIMQSNSIVQYLPDGKEGEVYGFRDINALLAVPWIQNLDSPDFVGFCMEKDVLWAFYDPRNGHIPVVRVGRIKYPEKVGFPDITTFLAALAAQGLRTTEFKSPDAPPEPLPPAPEGD